MHPAIQSSLREGVRAFAEPVGPFLVHFDANSESPFRNYAVPDDGAEPSAAEVAALVAAFTARSRRARLEYVVPAPAVEAALEAAGFTVDLRLALMTLTAGDLVEPSVPGDVVVRMVDADDDLWAAARVQNAAYGEAEATEADVSRLRSTVAAGGGVCLAWCEGAPAGSGLFAPPANGLSEIAAVGVQAQYRRRHVASLVGAELSRRVLAAGVTPYLQTESRNEQRLYGRLGYRPAGELVASSLSA